MFAVSSVGEIGLHCSLAELAVRCCNAIICESPYSHLRMLRKLALYGGAARVRRMWRGS